MSIYSNDENKIVLWNAIQSFPLFIESFNNPEAKEIWFNKIINQFQYQLPAIITKKDLMKINQETIKFIIQKLQNKNEIPEPKYGNISSTPSRMQNIIVGSELDTIYTQRQKEYQEMRTEHSPPEIDFRNNVIDIPLKNIDELVQERETIFNFNPSPINIEANNKNVNSIQIDVNSTLQSLNDIVELGNINIIDEIPNNKKQVNWAPLIHIEDINSNYGSNISVLEKLTSSESKMVLMMDIMEKNFTTNNNILPIHKYNINNDDMSLFEKSFIKKSYL